MAELTPMKMIFQQKARAAMSAEVLAILLNIVEIKRMRKAHSKKNEGSDD